MNSEIKNEEAQDTSDTETQPEAEKEASEDSADSEEPADMQPSKEKEGEEKPTDKPKKGWVGNHNMTGVPKEGVPPSFIP